MVTKNIITKQNYFIIYKYSKMKTIGRVSILLFLIVLLVIISSIQKIQENFTTEEFIREGEILDEANQKILNLSDEEVSNLMLSSNITS